MQQPHATINIIYEKLAECLHWSEHETMTSILLEQFDVCSNFIAKVSNENCEAFINNYNVLRVLFITNHLITDMEAIQPYTAVNNSAGEHNRK